MMSLRHEAHRRGMYLVVGTISLIETAAGVLRFPVQMSKPTGPTVGYVTDGEGTPDPQKLVVLTPWEGIPDLHEKTETFCSHCLADCFVCNATGKKRCEGLQCGGRGWTPGPFEDCDGAGCVVENGRFNPDCKKCRGTGHLAPPVECLMCKGSGVMVCSFCKGSTRYATGIKDGGSDFEAGRCTFCNGEQREIITRPQKLEPHINAMLPDPKTGPICAIGPIVTLVVDLTEENAKQIGTPLRIFDVKADHAGDHLFLLLDSSSSPAWPYLVGGFIVERNRESGIETRGRIGLVAELPR